MLTAIRLITFALVCCVHGVTTPYVATVVPDSKNMQAPAVERRVHVNPLGANDSRYAYIPFDVPPHAVRISISYQYDRANEANTIDIGLFDARSTSSDIDPNGFRGWSGGRRSEFFVSREEATPGYLPGEMPAGTWRIILGLYRVVPAGVDVSFKIGIETDENKSSSPMHAKDQLNPSSPGPGTTAPNERRPSYPEQRVAGQSPRWWSGDLHMHTIHSDGDWTI